MVTIKKQYTTPMNYPIEKSFALLIILTESGETLMRPIGGLWDGGINDAIKDMNQKYPGCKMKIYEDNYRPSKYFIPNGVPKERVLP